MWIGEEVNVQIKAETIPPLHGNDYDKSLSADPSKFTDRPIQVRNVLESVCAGHRIELVVPKWQSFNAPGDEIHFRVTVPHRIVDEDIDARRPLDFGVSGQIGD